MARRDPIGFAKFKKGMVDRMLGSACRVRQIVLMENGVAENNNQSKEDRTAKLNFPDIELARQLFGDYDRHLKQLADALGVKINARWSDVIVSGQVIQSDLEGKKKNKLYWMLKDGYQV